MSTELNGPIDERFKNALLNRHTPSTKFTQVVKLIHDLKTNGTSHENVYHKVTVNNWKEDASTLFTVLSDYFCPIIPVKYVHKCDIVTFYTNSLEFILKVMRFTFVFPYLKTICNLELLFNTSTSIELFGSTILLNRIIENAIEIRTNRYTDLDLSNFSNDKCFLSHNICFFSLTLLLKFPNILAKLKKRIISLNLSNNNISEVPISLIDILAIDRKFLELDLSNNNMDNWQKEDIPLSLATLQGIKTVKIADFVQLLKLPNTLERLKLEGNPICENMQPEDYLQTVISRFPKLKELDGVLLNSQGNAIPYWRNFISNHDFTMKILVDKFLTLYFSYFDTTRNYMGLFYHYCATLSLSTSFTEAQEATLPSFYSLYTRNACSNGCPTKREIMAVGGRLFDTRASILGVLGYFPATMHDPSTFTVDVIQLSNESFIIIVDGVYKHLTHVPANLDEQFIQFRRTFQVCSNFNNVQNVIMYQIKNELISLSFACKEVAEISFKKPVRNLNSLCVLNPTKDESIAIMKTFQHITHLNSEEAHRRLAFHKWDIKKSLEAFNVDLSNNSITVDKLKFNLI